MKKKILIITGAILLAVIFTGGSMALRYYHTFYRPNVHPANEPLFIYIPTNASFHTLIDSLQTKKCLRNINSFIRAAKKEQLPQRIKGGRYLLALGMNNKTVVRTFTLGLQAPVRLVIPDRIRSVGKLAAVLSRPLETDSLSMHQILVNDSILHTFGFDSTSLFSMILPNTYEVYWNTLPIKILERLHKEYQRWWSDDRKQLAAKIGLTPLQVSTLASIVLEETNYQPEMATIAGVYMNRLKSGMLLQADPTVIFALRDPTIRRLLSKDTKIDSPYNTYKYKGLPPGPICVPTMATLEAVLHHQTHKYLYFCASPDFNGSHLFAVNYNDHLRNARAFQQALNQRGIRR